MSNYYAGENITFNYRGGSNPGSRRVTHVLNVDADNLTCWDFDKQELRTFTKSKMTNVEYLSHQYVDLDMLPVSLQDGKQIVKDFETEGCKCYITSDKEVIAVKIKKELKKIIGASHHLIIPGPFGKVEITTDYEANRVTVTTIDGEHVYNANAEDLYKALGDLFIPF